MKPINTYKLTFELYFDDTHGHFYNFLVRYYDHNSKVHTNKATSTEYRLYSFEVAKILKLTTVTQPRWSAALVQFPFDKLYCLEKLFYHAKNCIVHESTFLNGRIYNQFFDNLIDMRTNFWRKLANMKTIIQTEQQFINNIQEL